MKRQRIYSETYREEEAARKRRHYAINREEELARCHHYQETRPKGEEYLARKRWYYQIHREEYIARKRHYRQVHREECAARRRCYREANRERYMANASRWRARLAGAFGADYTTAVMITARCEYYGKLCYICGKPMEAVDHVKPLAKGGAHLPCNIRPICKRCNSSKKDRWPFAYAI